MGKEVGGAMREVDFTGYLVIMGDLFFLTYSVFFVRTFVFGGYGRPRDSRLVDCELGASKGSQFCPLG